MSFGMLGLAMGVNFANGFLSGVRDGNKAYLSAKDYDYQAQIFKRNADLVRLYGAMNEDVMRAKNRAYISNGVAAANEVGMAESPTFVSALAYNGSLLEQNVLNERYKTESEAENYLYQSRVMAQNAHQMRKKSRGAFRSGLISGISSALGVYSSYGI